MKANKNTEKSWLVHLSMVDISTNFEDKIFRGSGENRSGSRAASVAGTGGTLYLAKLAKSDISLSRKTLFMMYRNCLPAAQECTP